MSFKLNAVILLAALLVANTNAGVVRIDAADTKVSVQKADIADSTTATTVKTTVLSAVPKERETKEVQIEDDVDATTTIATIIAEDQPRAVTRDTDATIEIAKTSLDPAPGTIAEEDVDLTVDLEVLQADENKSENVTVSKSAALLLLSIPNHEKPKQLEENIEEPEELPEEGSTQETTTETVVTTTESPIVDTTTTLIYTNDTLAQEEEKKSVDKTANVDTVQEASPVAPSDNAGATLLVAEFGDDFVIFDSDVEQFGSFTHIDSDEHLQPIVQSVEIVPTSVDDSLIVTYVHSW